MLRNYYEIVTENPVAGACWRGRVRITRAYNARASWKAASCKLQAPKKSLLRAHEQAAFMKEASTMKYEVVFNRARKVWMVWAISLSGNAEVVKTFKTETAARKWVEKKA